MFEWLSYFIQKRSRNFTLKNLEENSEKKCFEIKIARIIKYDWKIQGRVKRKGIYHLKILIR